MALSLDDKLLGEKVDNYCSSSEDEGGDSDNGDSENQESIGTVKQPTFIPEPSLDQYSGTCTNTGPKGVINDWREFKRLETEKREHQERERQQLMKKLSMTCRSHLDDEQEKKEDKNLMLQLEDIEDEFMKAYRQKRMEEMRRALDRTPKFGTVVNLSKEGFIDCIDKENSQVKVLIHVYEDGVQACQAMDGCFSCLAKDYQNMKFCRLRASDAKLSQKFSVNGVPAIIVYKKGELINSFIRMSDDLGDDFFATDVESFLQEHGVLPHNAPTAIRDTTTGEIRGTLPQDEDDDLD